MNISPRDQKKKKKKAQVIACNTQYSQYPGNTNFLFKNKLFKWILFRKFTK